MQFLNEFYCLPCLCDFILNFIFLLILVSLLPVSDFFHSSTTLCYQACFCLPFLLHLQLFTLKQNFFNNNEKRQKKIKILHKSFFSFNCYLTSLIPYFKNQQSVPTFSISPYIYKWVFYFLWLNLLELFPRVQRFFSKNALLMDESNGPLVISILLKISDGFDHIRFYSLS